MSEFDEEYDEWVPAIEAAKLLIDRFGSLTRAKEALTAGLREGALTTGAEGTAIAEGDEAEPIEATPPDGELIEIPHERWSQSAIWDSDRLGWDWDIGAFDIYNEDSSYAHSGVHFLRSEVEAIEPASFPYATVGTPGDSPSSGAKVLPRERKAARKWDWEKPLAELIALADLDGLENVLRVPFERGFQAKLETWLAEWFEGPEHDGASPSEAECRRRAALIVEAMERLRASRSRI